MRIGSGPGGVADVCSHQWFRDFDFNELIEGRIQPPYVPNLRSLDDDGNFGPMDWRGEPVLTDPTYDVAAWETVWDESRWS